MANCVSKERTVRFGFPKLRNNKNWAAYKQLDAATVSVTDCSAVKQMRFDLPVGMTYD